MQLVREYNQNDNINEFFQILNFIKTFENSNEILNLLAQWKAYIEEKENEMQLPPGWAEQQISSGMCYSLSVWWLMEVVANQTSQGFMAKGLDRNIQDFLILVSATLNYKAAGLNESVDGIDSLQESLKIITGSIGKSVDSDIKLKLKEVPPETPYTGAPGLVYIDFADGGKHVVALCGDILFEPNAGEYQFVIQNGSTYGQVFEQIMNSLYQDVQCKAYLYLVEEDTE